LQNENDLQDAVVAIGSLIGLLTENNGTVSFNTDWFSDPVTELKQTDTRLNYLAELLSSIFTAAATPPDVFADAQWYPIPNPDSGGPSPFYIVTSSGADDAGQFGVGLLYPVIIGNLTIQSFAYLPLFAYDPNGVTFITNSASNPVQIGLYITTSDTFSVDGVTFTALKIDAGIYFSDTPPTFAITFENVAGAGSTTTGCTTTDGVTTCSYTSLSSLLSLPVSGWLGEVFVQGSSWLNLYVGDSTSTIGDLLVAANFLTKDTEGNYNLSLANLQGSSPTQIALNFVFAILNGLADLSIPIISLPGGGIYVVNAVNGNSTDYGIRLAFDVPLPSPQSTGNSPPPAVDLCLGAWFTGETDTANWISTITGSSPPAGLSIFFLNNLSSNGSNTLSFNPGFEFTSMGINIAGSGGAPLINLNGYTLNGAELRFYLNANDSLTPGNWTYGFALRLDQIGFPLSPSFSDAQQGSSSNMVAKCLMSSNGSTGDASSTGAVNPAFSAEAGYISVPSGTQPGPLLQIYNAQGVPTDVIWFPIQRRFGPINCQQVGLDVDVTSSDPQLGIIFDGSVSFGGLNVYLDQLSILADLKEITDPSGYDVDLQGMSVTFNGGGVEISGGLLKTIDKTTGFIGYDGEVLIKAENLALAALGSFGSLPAAQGGGTSLFIFAILNAPLGGPTFFFVTGLAAGFGYNRSLKIPAQSDVQDFPLLAMLANSPPPGSAAPTPETVLATLEQWVPPAMGEYWLAAGLQFTTFEIINTNALLIVEFGKEFVISLLGLSTLKQPMVGQAYVYAELEMEVVLDPDAGEFQASAVLSSGSYLFLQSVHLTGGFAFYAWFGSNAHSGDFAFTIGGYHPAFQVPSYYPQEPRVGINWPISDKILMNGDAYFAITPVAMMAGGDLALTFTDGPLKAWLKAQIDVIVDWKPFYIIADASVSVGVSYRVNALFVHKTISVEIGATFNFWGPPVGGKVHVDYYIVSFTISFGPDLNPTTTLTWTDFKGLLPSKTQQQTSPAPTEALVTGVGPANDTTTTTTLPAYLCINAVDGLLTTQTQDSLTLWLVRAGQFQFTVGSAIPATTIFVGDTSNSNNVSFTGQPVGLLRVNGGISPQNYVSKQTITLLQLSADDVSTIQACMATANPCTTQPAGCTAQVPPVTGWQINPVTQNLPQAMWGSAANSSINQSPPTVTGTTGVTMSPAAPVVTNCTPEMLIDEIFPGLTVNSGNEYTMPLSQTAQPLANQPQAANSFADIANVNDAAVVAERNAVFASLQSLGVYAWTNDPLPLMAANPGKDFADAPMEGSAAPTQS
jgi:hypothetical protein